MININKYVAKLMLPILLILFFSGCLQKTSLDNDAINKFKKDIKKQYSLIKSLKVYNAADSLVFEYQVNDNSKKEDLDKVFKKNCEFIFENNYDSLRIYINFQAKDLHYSYETALKKDSNSNKTSEIDYNNWIVSDASGKEIDRIAIDKK